MIYSTQTSGGRTLVTTVLPRALNKIGEVELHRVLGHECTDRGVKLLLDTGFIIVKDVMTVEELEPDSIPEHKLYFPTMEEVAKKWTPERQRTVVSHTKIDKRHADNIMKGKRNAAELSRSTEAGSETRGGLR